MAEVKWIKINVDMFDDEKIKIIQSMPEGDALLIVWIKLITLAGKTNDGGYVYIAENMPYTDEMLSVIMNKPLNTIRLALDTFNKLGMVENDIRGIYLVNFEKHQSLDKLAEIREKNRLRVKKFRDKQKQLECNVTETLCNDIDIDKELDIEEDKEIEKDKKKKERKKSYGEYQNVKLLDKEYQSLIRDYGSSTEDIIKYLDEYIEMKGTKYKSCYMAIRKWVAEAVKQKASKTTTRKEMVPEWMNKKLEAGEMTKEQQEEMDNLFKEFDSPKLASKERIEEIKERLMNGE